MKWISGVLTVMYSAVPCYAVSTNSVAGVSVQSEHQPATYEVSQKCMENLENINNDYMYLNYYCMSMVPASDSVHVSTFLQEIQKSIDNNVQKFYAPATYYVQRVNNKYGHIFDSEFEKQKRQIIDSKVTWLCIQNLFCEKLKEETINLKMELVQEDDKYIALCTKNAISTEGILRIYSMYIQKLS